MNSERQNKIDELRWLNERKETLSKLKPLLSSFLPKEAIDFLSFEESDSFQLKTDEWPVKKYEKELFLQYEIDRTEDVETTLQHFLNLIKGTEAYIFLLQYNFGLIKISKNELTKSWGNLIELDGDEFFCYNPETTDFICIEKTEDLISGREQEGRMWIYEITFSNQLLKEKITTHNKS